MEELRNVTVAWSTAYPYTPFVAIHPSSVILWGTGRRTTRETRRFVFVRFLASHRIVKA